jgi:hypothetical protein
MTLISPNVKENILIKLSDILNIDEPNWLGLELDLKLKILHNMCNAFKPNFNKDNVGLIKIPLKNLRPKKIIELAGINKNANSEIFEEFKKKLIETNRNFRNNHNSKNKNYCFANLSTETFNGILNDYNYEVYLFLNKYKSLINQKKFFYNLIGGNNDKIIQTNIEQKNKNIKIEKICYKDKFLNFDFNNGVSVQLELFLTSEKISSNIPAKYKIYLINIF